MNPSHFIRKGQTMPPFMAYPRFLLDTDLSDTARLLYILLLNRCRLSAKRQEFLDREGNVFVNYPIKELASDCRRSDTSVKNALLQLENADLLYKQNPYGGRPCRLYVKLPSEPQSPKPEAADRLPGNSQKAVSSAGRIPPAVQAENSLLYSKDPFCSTDIFLAQLYNV